jgi:dynactin complex subunit
MFSDNTFESTRKQNADTPNERSASQMSDMFDSANIVEVHPGDMVQIKSSADDDTPEIGMVHYVQTEGTLVGVELEGPIGKADGTRDGHRYFRTPPNCAKFIKKSEIQRILPLGGPPRFHSRAHDIYPGDVVMVDKNVGVGIARYVSAHLIGVELNAPAGDSDGSYNGQRFFQVKEKYALFKAPSILKKIHPEDLLNKLNQTVEKLNQALAPKS